MATASAKFIVNLAKKLPPICIYNYILTLKMKKKKLFIMPQIIKKVIL